MSQLDNEKTFLCDQAELEVTFEWNIKNISSGMDAEAYQKVSRYKCSGIRSEKCPARHGSKPADVGELAGIGKCNFFRSLR